jgi:methionyl aminopeptidase
MIVLKRPEELAAMRRAGRVTAVAAEDAIREAGATPSFKGNGGFPASLCLSVNDEVVHGMPRDLRLREGDVLSIDVGAYIGGFHGDTATTVPVGEIDPEVARLLRITEEALYHAITLATPDHHLSDISHAVEAFVRPHGYGIVKELVGHGIGRTVWEDPQVPNYGPPGKGPPLREGMTLAIEPMVTMGRDDVYIDDDGWTVRTRDGKPAAHFEHTVAIGPKPEILTVV